MKPGCNHRLYIRSARSHRDVNRWFVDCRFEASSSAFWPSPSCYLQPEVTRDGGAKYNRTLNKTFLDDQNVPINFHEMITHCERVKVVKAFIQVFWFVRLIYTSCRLFVTPPDCVKALRHALKHTLLYGLSDSKWDHNLLKEHHAVLKKTWN